MYSKKKKHNWRFTKASTAATRRSALRTDGETIKAALVRGERTLACSVVEY